MRAGTALLLAVAAFVAGLLAGRFSAPRDGARAPPRDAAAGLPPPMAPGNDVERAGVRLATPGASALRDASVDSPDEDQPLEPGAEFARWDGTEFARWYAIHKSAWDLPDIDAKDLATFGEHLLALDRIPRRDQLVRLLRELLAWQAEVERVSEENDAWHAANPDAAESDPGAIACLQRLVDAHQRFLDAMHQELRYPDYLALFARVEQRALIVDGVSVRPPSSSADAYARPVAVARRADVFERWYRGYAQLLGFPERDEDFLDGFHRHVVRPLGRLPDPALMRTLQEVYAPLHARLAGGEEWEDAVERLFSALDRVLPLLDYERIRYSREWDRYPELVPPPTDR